MCESENDYILQFSVKLDCVFKRKIKSFGKVPVGTCVYIFGHGKPYNDGGTF